MAEVREQYLRWRHQGQSLTVVAVLDDADFDVDLITLERYRRLLRVEIDGTIVRAGEFALTVPGRAAVKTTVTDSRRQTITPAARITEKGLRWDYTPEHVDVVRGSVSAPSLLTSGGVAGGASSQVTAAFTPTADGLLVVSWGTNTGAPAGITYTITNTHAGSGAWSQVAINSPNNVERNSQARSQTGASPGSGTITNTFSSSADNNAWIVAEVAGHDTTTPLSESNTGSANSGTSLTIVLGDIAAGNRGIATIMTRGNSSPVFTPGTDWTEDTGFEVSAGGGSNLTTQMQHSTAVSTDPSWTWSTSSAHAAVAIEFAQAAGAATSLVPKRRSSQAAMLVR